jgi:hypothetical protein
MEIVAIERLSERIDQQSRAGDLQYRMTGSRANSHCMSTVYRQPLRTTLPWSGVLPE